MVILDRCNKSCNALNDTSDRRYVPNEAGHVKLI